MKTDTELNGLPQVAISAFKANPARYLETGALVTAHGHIRAAFVPLDEEPADSGLDAVKAQLSLLGRMTDPEDVAEELRELRAARDADRLGPAR